MLYFIQLFSFFVFCFLLASCGGSGGSGGYGGSGGSGGSVDLVKASSELSRSVREESPPSSEETIDPRLSYGSIIEKPVEFRDANNAKTSLQPAPESENPIQPISKPAGVAWEGEPASLAKNEPINPANEPINPAFKSYCQQQYPTVVLYKDHLYKGIVLAYKVSVERAEDNSDFESFMSGTDEFFSPSEVTLNDNAIVLFPNLNSDGWDDIYTYRIKNPINVENNIVITEDGILLCKDKNTCFGDLENYSLFDSYVSSIRDGNDFSSLVSAMDRSDFIVNPCDDGVVSMLHTLSLPDSNFDSQATYTSDVSDYESDGSNLNNLKFKWSPAANKLENNS